MTFKIASWNVNSVKARLEHVKTYLHDRKPDILFLQELKGENLPDISEDYEAMFIGQKAYNGVATLIRKPTSAQLILNKLPLMDEEADDHARYLEVEWNNLRLINIYLPNGNPLGTEKYTYKIKWMERLFKHLSELRSRRVPFLIGGDFNVIPEDKDCFDPVLWRGDALYHPPTVNQFRKLLNLGLTDAYRVFSNGAEEYTFWDYQAGAWPRNRGIRIDHFLTSPSVTDRLVSCTIDKTPRSWDTPSDHTPIMIELAE